MKTGHTCNLIFLSVFMKVIRRNTRNLHGHNDVPRNKESSLQVPRLSRYTKPIFQGRS